MQSTSSQSTSSPVSIQKSPRRLFMGRPHPEDALLLLPEQEALPKEKSPKATLAVDIYQSEKEIIICAPIAGVHKESLTLQMDADVLTIEGRREFPIHEEVQAIVQEVYWGAFSRSVILPDFIDRSKIQASTTGKLLVIRIPKTEDFKTRLIQIDEKTD